MENVHVNKYNYNTYTEFLQFKVNLRHFKEKENVRDGSIQYCLSKCKCLVLNFEELQYKFQQITTDLH